MILTSQLITLSILCGIAVKGIVDVSFSVVKSFLDKRTMKLEQIKRLKNLDNEEEGIEVVEEVESSPELKWRFILMIMFFEFIELLLVGYVLFHTGLFIPILLFSVVLANFFVSWLAILCQLDYIFKNPTTKVAWAQFSLNFGFFKNVTCILSFLIYIIGI